MRRHGPDPNSLHAFVDESKSGNERLYTMTALLVDNARLDEVKRGVQQIAGDHFHAVEATDEQRRAMVNYLAGQPGVASIVTVRAPVEPNDESIREARKHCLTELTAQLGQVSLPSVGPDGEQVNKKVAGMTLDHLWVGELHASNAENRKDYQTINECKRAGLVPDNFKASHEDDRRSLGLQAADAVAWTARYAVQHDQPDRLVPLAGKVHLVEAQKVPASQRQERAGSGLQLLLNRLNARAGHANLDKAVKDLEALRKTGKAEPKDLKKLAAAKERLPQAAQRRDQLDKHTGPATLRRLVEDRNRPGGTAGGPRQR